MLGFHFCVSFQNDDGPSLRRKILAGRALDVLRRHLLRRLVQTIDRIERAGRRNERHHRLGRVQRRIELHQEAVLLMLLHLGKLLGINQLGLESLDRRFQHFLHRRAGLPAA